MEYKKTKYDIHLQRAFWSFSIVTGIFSIIFALFQLSINAKLMREAKIKDQPVFQVHFDYWQSGSHDINDHVDFRVECKGEEPRKIETPNLYTYIKFDYSGNYKESPKIFYIPIEYYFGWVLPTHNLKGKVAFTYTSTPNNAYSYKLYTESIEYSQVEHVNAFVSTIHITEIHYLDKYNEAKKVYFINEENVDEKDAKEIIQKSEEQFGYNKWRIEDLSMLKIKEICSIETSK